MERGDQFFLELALVTGTFPVLETHPEEQETWIPTKQRFSGKVYINGRAQFPSVPFLRRRGFAVVSLDDQVNWSARRAPALSQPACAVEGHSRGSRTRCQPHRQWCCCVRCAMPIHHCRLATIASSWATPGAEAVELERPQVRRWPTCGDRFGRSSISRAGKGNSTCASWRRTLPSTPVGPKKESATWLATRSLIWQPSVRWRLGAKTLTVQTNICGRTKCARAVAANVAQSQPFCLQNFPLASNDVPVWKAAAVHQPPRRAPAQPQLVVHAPHGTHAVWVADDFVICMRCGSWAKLHRAGHGLRVPCSFVLTEKCRDINRVPTGRRPWD